MVPFQVFTLESEKLHFLNITILQCSICSVGRSNNWLPTGCFETLGPVRMTLSVPRSPDRLNKLPLEENLIRFSIRKYTCPYRNRCQQVKNISEYLKIFFTLIILSLNFTLNINIKIFIYYIIFGSRESKFLIKLMLTIMYGKGQADDVY